MRALIALYRQQFKTTFAMMLQYRASLIIWMIGHVLEPLVYLIVWSKVTSGRGGKVGDYTAQSFAAYFIVLMLVNHATYTWIMYEFEYRIRQGIFSSALLKPVHPIHSDIADNLSSKLITFPLMLLIAFVLALMFHAEFSPQPWAFVLFVPVIFFAFLLRFLLEWSLAQAAFWTTRVRAINQSYFVLVLFLSGQLAPLSIFPHFFQVIAEVLPFRWMISFPVELLLGRLTLSQTVVGLNVQMIWLIISLVLIRKMWRTGVRLYSAVGA